MVTSFSVFVNLGLEQRTSAGTIVETLASRAARPPFSVSAIPVDRCTSHLPSRTKDEPYPSRFAILGCGRPPNSAGIHIYIDCIDCIDYQRTILSAGETAVSRGNALSLLSDIGAVLALLVLRPGIDLTREIWGPVHNSPVRWGVELAPAAISLLTIASRPRSLATLSGVQPWLVCWCTLAPAANRSSTTVLWPNSTA